MSALHHDEDDVDGDAHDRHDDDDADEKGRQEIAVAVLLVFEGVENNNCGCGCCGCPSDEASDDHRRADGDERCRCRLCDPRHDHHHDHVGGDDLVREKRAVVDQCYWVCGEVMTRTMVMNEKAENLHCCCFVASLSVSGHVSGRVAEWREG